MPIETKQKKSKVAFKTDIEKIIAKIKEADQVVIGAGPGLSASAGLDYKDETLFKNMYAPFYKKGYKTIADAIEQHWLLSNDNASSYWGFWAYHLHHSYYNFRQLPLYESLYDLIKEKSYFVITTNTDGQFLKAGFDADKIFAMQGSYKYFQCQNDSQGNIYDNHEMIQQMLKGFDEDTLKVGEEAIPHCPKCGGLLCPNLRIDQHFVEDSHKENKVSYAEFVDVGDEKIVFMEIGVGFKGVATIRKPFEELTASYRNATLIRINATLLETPEEIQDKSIVIGQPIRKVIESIAELR